MEYRQLGRSGLRISAMTLGTMGFGGGGVFANVGTGDVQDARRQIDLALRRRGVIRDRHGGHLLDGQDGGDRR